MASVASPRMVERKTILTEQVPADEVTHRKKREDRAPVFEFLPTIPLQDWKDGRYIIYLYRYSPVTEKRMAVEKFAEPIDIFSIKRQFGGGHFNMLVKEDSQLIYNEDFEIEGDPIIGGTPQSIAQPVGNASNNPMIEAMRMAMNPEIMRSMFEMFKMASMESMAMMRAQMPAPVDPLQTLRNAKEILGGGSSPMDDLMKQFMTAMIQKMMNPPETNSFKETMGLVNEIKSSGLFGVAPKSDLTSTLVANLPMLADKVVGGLHEYRLQAEATERTIRLQAGQLQPGDARTINMDEQRQPNPSQPAVPAAPASPVSGVSPEQAQQIIAASHLHRLVAGIKQPDSTGEDMYDYLRNAWPEALDELTQLNKDQLLMLFRSPDIQMAKLGNTILSEVAGDPRLPKMIEDFLAIAKKEAAAEAAAKPTATV